MDAFPAFFPLAGRTVAIVGEGEPAEAKARLFDGSPAMILRIAIADAADPAAYRAACLAFIAAAEPAFREAAALAARRAGCVVNVVDHPALSDFITPAIIDRGAVVAAVSTSGAAPLLSALLRNDIEARIPAGAGRLASLFGDARQRLREALPDLDDRRAFLREALTGPAAQAALNDEMGAAEQLLQDALDAWRGPLSRPGRLCIVIEGGESDLISLRAARVLAEADVLVAAAGATPATLALARREARRLPAAEADLGRLAAFFAQGLKVVWVGSGPLDASLVEALAARGVAMERLSPAPA